MIKKPELRYLHMDITVKCNLTCKHCFYGDFNKKEFFQQEVELERLYEIVDEAKSMGCERIILSGGEVLTSNKFFPLLEYCKNRGINNIFISNLTLLNDENLFKLQQFADNITEIKVSFEGKNNDFIRGNGTEKIILKNIKKLDHLKLPWTINTIINKYNVNHLNDIYQFLKSHHPKAWRIDLPFNAGRYKQYKNDIHEENYELVFKRLSEVIKNYLDERPDFELWIFNVFQPGIEDCDFVEKTQDMHPCAYNKRNLGIRGLGEVTPCSRFLQLELGNIKNESIRNVKESDRFKNFWNIELSDFRECQKCKYLKICGCGCRAFAYEAYGDIMRKDPLNCEVMPLFEKYIIPLFSQETQKSFHRLTSNEKLVTESRKL
ncbi:radical SAM/SPASM domain-containing protein [Paenibacillus jiagnxiensis]|uniref:radical SAM/SPASM domain-containing protein n=1 Tax=Paenibacillus jiagnxiensis TaxID=3228926 RepID=UPI00339F7663